MLVAIIRLTRDIAGVLQCDNNRVHLGSQWQLVNTPTLLIILILKGMRYFDFLFEVCHSGTGPSSKSCQVQHFLP